MRKAQAEARAGLMKGIEVLEFALSIRNLDLGGRLEVAVACGSRREPLESSPTSRRLISPRWCRWTMPIAIAPHSETLTSGSPPTRLPSQREKSPPLAEAGLPNGILTVLHGAGPTVDAIIDHPLVQAVGFVGSTKIAKLVYTRATGLGKRALALGGAKNHIVLLPDANPELSGTGIFRFLHRMRRPALRGMAASVLLAVGDIDHHVEKIIARAKSLELGKDMGAIITRAQVEFLHAAITRAEKAGAKVLLDGRKVKAPNGKEGGNWLGPTILDHVTAGAEAGRP